MPSTSTGRVLRDLREKAGLTQQELARLLSWAKPDFVGRRERGDQELTPEHLEWIAGQMGYPREEVELRLFVEDLLARQEIQEAPSPVALTAEELRGLVRTGLSAAWSVADAVVTGLARDRRQAKAARALAAAAEACESLLASTPERRRTLVEVFPEFRTWGVAVRLCEASVRAAAHRAEEALALAELACRIARRVEEAPGWRSRLEGYCLAHLGNTRRVANDFDGADETFTRAWERWRAGGDADPPLLEEWRLYSLEASLRRAQHRFEEALELLDRAVTASGGRDEAVARLLLKKANVFEQSGAYEAALGALEEAAPLLEAPGDRHLLFGHRFNTADNLRRLERYSEAAQLLPEIRERALEQGKQLNLTRVLWLEAQVRAGLGEKDEAMAVLDQVVRYFTEQELPYDAALSSLDLAILWLETGSAAEVRQLALGLAWIFKVQKIRREALTALRLFCVAAQREAATVALARRAIAEIEKARRSAPHAG